MGEKKKSLEERIASLERLRWIVGVGIASFAVLGITAGSLLKVGYDGLKDREVEIRKEFERLFVESRTVAEQHNRLKEENIRIVQDAVDRCAKAADAVMELRRKITSVSDVAEQARNKSGELLEAVRRASEAAEVSKKAEAENKKLLQSVQASQAKVELACRNLEATQKAFEAYVSKRMANPQNEKFTITISGFSSSYTFREGDSVPFSRTFSGSHGSGIVIVPRGSICIVKICSSHCTVNIEKKLEGRVIVESSGFDSSVRYF